MPRDPLVFLDDILESCRKIEVYRADLDFEAFQADEKTIDAIVRNLPAWTGSELPACGTF